MSEFMKLAILEILKGIVTLIFGIISFKIFQMYKSKKDNMKLYIGIIKLKEELIRNKKILKEILSKHIRREELKLKIYINSDIEEKFNYIYNWVKNISDYSYIEEIREEGEVVDIKELYI